MDSVLAPLASQRVTTIVGFTEIDAAGRLYNAAAVLRNGIVAGLYRKLYPAIRRSVYQPGEPARPRSSRPTAGSCTPRVGSRRTCWSRTSA